MAVLADFVFFDASSTSTTSNTLRVPPDADALVMQVEKLSDDATVSLTLQGQTDLNGDNPWVNLAVMDHTAFTTGSAINAEGIYAVAASGIRLMRVVSGGSAGSVRVHAVAIS